MSRGPSNVTSGLDDLLSIDNITNQQGINHTEGNVMVQRSNPVTNNNPTPMINNNPVIPVNLLPPSNYNPASSQPFTDQLKRNSLLTEGVLHQDEYIQIGYKSEYSNGLGRMMIYYGNTSGHQLSQFRTIVTSTPFVSLNAQPVAPVIDPRTQMQQLITMTSTVAEFGSFPSLDVSFVVNGRTIQFNTQLAIVLSKFVEPMSIQGGEFFQQWKNLDSNGPHNIQTVVKSSRPVDITAVSKLMITGMKITLLNNVDPNLNNIVGCGNYATPTGKTPFLVRIESNPDHSMYRLSVRSQNAAVAAGVNRLLEAHLA